MASEAKRAKQEFNQTFYEQLKCHICEASLRAGKTHWYRCKQDHMICQDCREVKDEKKCSCTKFIPFKFCKVIEALLNTDKMEFKCENLARGCQETMEKDDMIFHQTECVYRLVKCPCITCEFEVPFHELLKHMEKEKCTVDFRYRIKNQNYIVKKTTFGKKTKEYQYFHGSRLPERVEIENKTFFIIGKLKDGSFYHWIYFVGPIHEAKNFSNTVEYFQKESDKIAFSQTSEIFSVDETADSIIENGKCLGAPTKYFCSKVARESGRFDFTYEIRNLKEEAKDENVESGVDE